MKRKLTLALLTMAVLMGAGAQSLTPSLSVPSIVEGGANVTLTLTFADASPSANVAAFQWALTLPAGVTAGTAVATTADATLAKIISCGPSLCLLGGFGTTPNATAFSSGAIATVPLTVAASAIPGPLVISITNALGATTTGGPVTLTVSPVTLTVSSKYDLNGDGVVNGADVTLALNQANGTAPCTNAAILTPGSCNVADVVLVVLAALGVIH